MATRTVTTVFKVGGDQQYKESVRQINAELERLNSQMDLSNEIFQGQDTAMAQAQSAAQLMTQMFEKQGELITLYAQRLEAVRKAYAQMGEDAVRLRQKLADLQETMNGSAEGSDAYNTAKEDYDKTAKELEKLEVGMMKASTEANNLQTNMNKAEKVMYSLADSVEQIHDPMNAFVQDANEAGEGVKELGDESEDASHRAVAALEELAASDLFDRIREGFNEVRELMADCAQSYIAFESAIAGVEKTVDATADQMQALTTGIRDMSERIPASTTEIAAVAEAAGQLGIATEDILDFTEVMINLGESTNLSATQAAEALAKFANITQLDPSNYERLGSVIVDLGNKTATTEQDIVDMGTRLASTGELVGLTADQILAMAATFSALGIEAEAGGTAAAKMLRKMESAVEAYEPAMDVIKQTGESMRDLELMQANSSSDFKALADSIGLTSTELGKYVANAKLLEQFADISGMSAEEFRRAWGEDAVGALDDFVTGLGRIHEEGGSVTNTLSEMAGMSEVRLTNAIQTLSTSGGLLTETLEIANAAWEENTALAEEAGKRYETTESKITIFNNALNNLKIAIGEDFNSMLEPVIETGTKFVSWLADAAEETPALSAALAGLGGSLGALTGLAAVATGIKAVSTALALFGTTAAPVAAGVAIIGGLGAATAVYLSNAQILSDEAQALVDQNDALLASVENTQEAFDASELASGDKQQQVENLIDKVQALSEKVNQTAGDRYVIQAAVDELNEMLPGLGATFDETTGKVNLSADAMRDYAQSVLEAARTEAMQDYLQDLLRQQIELEMQYGKTTAELEASNETMNKNREAMKALADSGGILGYLSGEFREYNTAAINAEYAAVKLEGEQKELEAALSEVADAIDTVTNKLSGMGSAGGGSSVMARGVEEATEKYNELIEAAEKAYDETVDAAQKASTEAYDAYCDGLDDELDALEKNNEAALKAVEKQNNKLIKEKKKAQEQELDDLEDYLDEEMEALEKQYDAKVELIDAEYTERLRLLDEDRYNAIKQIEDEIAAIEAQTEAEEKAIEQREQADKIAKLEAAVRNAEDREERQKAEEALAEYLNELERNRILADRKERIEELKQRKESLNDEYDAKEDELEREKKAAVAAVEEEGKLEKEALKKIHEEKKALLKEQQDEELEQYKESLSAQKDALKESLDAQEEDFKGSMDGLKAAKKAQLDYELAEVEKTALAVYEEAAQKAKEVEDVWQRSAENVKRTLQNMAMYTDGKSIGDDFIAGINDSIQNALRDSTSDDYPTRRLARGLLSTMRDELEIHSPSRKAREIGQLFGEGLALGLDDGVDKVTAATRKLTDEMDISEAVTKKVEAVNRAVGKITVGADVASGAELRSIYASTAAMQHIASTVPVQMESESKGDTFMITMNVESIEELNDIVRIAEDKRVQIRMGKTKG